MGISLGFLWRVRGKNTLHNMFMAQARWEFDPPKMPAHLLLSTTHIMSHRVIPNRVWGRKKIIFFKTFLLYEKRLWSWKIFSKLRVFFLYNNDNYNGKTIDMEIIANFFFNQSAKNGIDIWASRKRRYDVIVKRRCKEIFHIDYTSAEVLLTNFAKTTYLISIILNQLIFQQFGKTLYVSQNTILDAK